MSSSPTPRFVQSAALPYRVGPNGLEVLLVTSCKRRRWILPKGLVDPALSPAQSAAKEALEEAGVEGEIGTIPLGTFTQPKWGGICEVTVYPLRVRRVLDRWPEAHLRTRRWFPAREAVAAVHRAQLRDLIARFIAAESQRNA